MCKGLIDYSFWSNTCVRVHSFKVEPGDYIFWPRIPLFCISQKLVILWVFGVGQSSWYLGTRTPRETFIFLVFNVGPGLQTLVSRLRGSIKKTNWSCVWWGRSWKMKHRKFSEITHWFTVCSCSTIFSVLTQLVGPHFAFRRNDSSILVWYAFNTGAKTHFFPERLGAPRS